MATASPSDYIMGIILMMAVVLGCIGMMGEVVRFNTDVVGDDFDTYNTFNSTFNQYAALSGNVTKIRTNIENTQTTDSVFLGVLGSLFTSAWQTLKVLFSSFGFMTTILETAVVILGIPNWVSGLILLSIIVMLGFAIYQAFMRTPL